MNKTIAKLSAGIAIFITGAVKQLEDPGTVGTAAAVGLIQGMKYNGNVSRGLKAAGATALVFGAANGINSVIKNIDIINAVVDAQED